LSNNNNNNKKHQQLQSAPASDTKILFAIRIFDCCEAVFIRGGAARRRSNANVIAKFFDLFVAEI